jgi:hypothetical protein
MEEGDRPATEAAGGFEDGGGVGTAGRSRPLSLTNRSMNGETVDACEAAGRVPPDSTGGGAVGRREDVWASLGAGAAQATSKAIAMIKGRAGFLRPTNPSLFMIASIRSRACGFPSSRALVHARGDQK